MGIRGEVRQTFKKTVSLAKVSSVIPVALAARPLTNGMILYRICTSEKEILETFQKTQRVLYYRLIVFLRICHTRECIDTMPFIL